MCGIVGYIGTKQAVPVLFEGLEKLEYRGYDSSGIAVLGSAGKLVIKKRKGRLAVLEKELAGCEPEGTLGIGHTRWATHGAPSDVNAHPHSNAAGDIVVAHNGIIENHVKIREWLSARGYSFRSQTDTELIAHLIDFYFTGETPLFDAVQSAVRHLEGSYALCIASSRAPDVLIAARKDSPLVIGIGDGENFVASDVSALLKYTRNVYFLDDGEFAVVKCDAVDMADAYGIPVYHEVFHVTWDVSAAEKGGYPHFMLKEINEQPKALADTLGANLDGDSIRFKDMELPEGLIKSFKRLVFICCGTAYHVGMVGKYLFERMLGVPVEIDVASEFRYRSAPIFDTDLAIVISQSGETLDTIAAMRLAKQKGATTLAVTNVMGSVISREADYVMYTLAGPEIAVASTKAYTTQLMCISLLAVEFAKQRGAIDKKEYGKLIDELRKVPDAVKSMFAWEEKLMRTANLFCSRDDVYFLGRNIDNAIAMEGSLKLKEVSYIHSESYPAGELKHGPIALIEDGTLVVAVATQSALVEKTASNMKEVKARGAYVLALCTEGEQRISDVADDTIRLPKLWDGFMPMPAIVPLQLFAYHCALERGFDVDKPRNLAKSVTVE